MENYPFYKNKRAERLANVPENLTLINREQQNNPKGYRPSDGLVNAVNVALLLGQPLLITGEPGTGKTELANSLNWQLGFKNPMPFSFETKSTTTARDLFYFYDTIGRFHASQTGQGSHENRDYITYNALGLAILFANPKSNIIDFLPNRNNKDHNLFQTISDIEWQRRSVVLIDEIDKAPRDFPNDILNEIDKMFFRVPELGNKIFEVKDENYRPIIILTSNSEKNLPEAFLRRCVYYNIEFPESDELKIIVDERLGKSGIPRSDKEFRWYDILINLFEQFRTGEQLVKKPTTAELLAWIAAVKYLLEHYEIPADDSKWKDYLTSRKGLENIINPTLCILLKNADDVIDADVIVNEWAKSG